MRPIVDGDILVYEIGFAAEVGWRAIKEDDEAIPDFDYVREMLHDRLNTICEAVGATTEPSLYLTKGMTFRDDVAVTKPYKGTRKDKKPWHYKNLRAYMEYVLNATVVTGIEADDAMVIDHLNSKDETVLCSRDKDLKQCPGLFYSWELGKQGAFGPVKIEDPGSLVLAKGPKLTGTGLAFFYAQLLMGDPVDNIPGCPKIGPKKAYDILSPVQDDGGLMLDAVSEQYIKAFGDTHWPEHLLEQGRLCWMVRRMNDNGTPQMWEIGMQE